MKYTEEIARETKDPKILTDILSAYNLNNTKVYDYWVPECAAYNPNCPPEILVEILKKGNEDDVSKYAAGNPNCPPEMLIEVLRRKNDSRFINYVSIHAVDNPNCPPEILTEILERGKYDKISWNAVENPNCPDEAKIKWMQATDKIEK